MTPQPRAPSPEGLNLEFYEHAASGTVHLQQCTACRRFRHPPRYLCAWCGSPEYQWTPSRGEGQLYTWTVTHFPFDRGWAEELPYATAVVELEEGVRLIGSPDGVETRDLRPGLPLVAVVDTETHGFPYVRFSHRTGGIR